MVRAIAERYNADLARSYIIGDRALGEVQLGHRAGWRTIWLQAGKFSGETPKTYTPDHRVASLTDIALLI